MMTISAVLISTKEICDVVTLLRTGASRGLLRAAPSAPPDRSTSTSALPTEVGGPPRRPRRGRGEEGEEQREEQHNLLRSRVQMMPP